MRTIVYVDGYNFYFGVLRGTPYKWLDIVGLVKYICHAKTLRSCSFGFQRF